MVYDVWRLQMKAKATNPQSLISWKISCWLFSISLLILLLGKLQIFLCCIQHDKYNKELQHNTSFFYFISLLLLLLLPLSNVTLFLFFFFLHNNHNRNHGFRKDHILHDISISDLICCLCCFCFTVNNITDIFRFSFQLCHNLSTQWLTMWMSRKK